MGMIGYLKRVPMETLNHILEGKATLTNFIFIEDEQDTSLDLDKAWHGIHFLLNTSVRDREAAYSAAILGGTFRWMRDQHGRYV